MSTALSENLRLAALDRCGILDTPPDPHFDRITRLAAQFFGAPMAAISFVAHDRSWFKSTYGFQQLQLARSASFCSHTIGCPEALVIPDATADERFAGLALVAGHPRVRFYAGVPVFTAEGFAVGAVAVMDTRPRGPLSESEICALHDFSALISRELNARPSAGAASQRRPVGLVNPVRYCSERRRCHHQHGPEQRHLDLESWRRAIIRILRRGGTGAPDRCDHPPGPPRRIARHDRERPNKGNPPCGARPSGFARTEADGSYR